MMTSQDYANQIDTWANKNWSKDLHHPDLGIAEELGEAAHCILKRKQKIRGFDNEAFFIEQLSDAFADAAIYLHHVIAKNNVVISLLPRHTGLNVKMTDRNFLAYNMRLAVQLLDYTEITDDSVDRSIFQACCQRLWNGLFFWAQSHKIDLIEALDTTWKKVSQRDWANNPTDAHVVAG